MNSVTSSDGGKQLENQVRNLRTTFKNIFEKPQPEASKNFYSSDKPDSGPGKEQAKHFVPSGSLKGTRKTPDNIEVGKFLAFKTKQNAKKEKKADELKKPDIISPFFEWHQDNRFRAKTKALSGFVDAMPALHPIGGNDSVA